MENFILDFGDKNGTVGYGDIINPGDETVVEVDDGDDDQDETILKVDDDDDDDEEETMSTMTTTMASEHDDDDEQEETMSTMTSTMVSKYDDNDEQEEKDKEVVDDQDKQQDSRTTTPSVDAETDSHLKEDIRRLTSELEKVEQRNAKEIQNIRKEYEDLLLQSETRNEELAKNGENTTSGPMLERITLVKYDDDDDEDEEESERGDDSEEQDEIKLIRPVAAALSEAREFNQNLADAARDLENDDGAYEDLKEQNDKLRETIQSELKMTFFQIVLETECDDDRFFIFSAGLIRFLFSILSSMFSN